MSTVYWGVCVPATCDPDDVSSAVSSVALRFHDVEVLVENDMCQMKRIPKKSTDFDWVRFWAAIFLLVMGMIGQGTICTPDELDRKLLFFYTRIIFVFETENMSKSLQSKNLFIVRYVLY